MRMSDHQILENLVSISRRAAALGYAVAGEGNTSARSSSGTRFWIKRSGCAFADVGPKDFVEMDVALAAGDLERPEEAIVHREDERFRPSIEVPMHASIYAFQDRANFVVHTHPPCTLAGCCTEDVEDFFLPQFPDSVVYLGVPERNWAFLEYASPGPGIAGLLRGALGELSGDLRVVILGNHGAMTIGETAAEALARTEMLEKASYVRLMSAITGKATTLAQKDIQFLENMEAEKYRQRVLKGDI